MKYESETGESMEKPGKKLKKLLIITGTTGAVYAGFKYLLPLVAPFSWVISWPFCCGRQPGSCPTV